MIDVIVVGGIFRETLLKGQGPAVKRYGGSGFTSAIAAARLGARTALLASVGEDDSEAIRWHLKSAGVDDNLLCEVGRASGEFMYPIQLSDATPWPMYRAADGIPRTLPSPLPPAKVTLLFGIPDYDPVQLHWLDGVDSSTTLIWDRQGWISRARDSCQVGQIPCNRKLYLANFSEALEEFGQHDRESLLQSMPPDRFSSAILKDGPRGVWTVTSEHGSAENSHSPAMVVEAESTVGSGDVFAGALSAGIAAGWSLNSAVTLGCAASSVMLQENSNLMSDHAALIARTLALPNR